jgi:hypothetical protein
MNGGAAGLGKIAVAHTCLAAAPRYVSLNPAGGQLVGRARDLRWSSVRAQDEAG